MESDAFVSGEDRCTKNLLSVGVEFDEAQIATDMQRYVFVKLNYDHRMLRYCGYGRHRANISGIPYNIRT